MRREKPVNIQQVCGCREPCAHAPAGCRTDIGACRGNQYSTDGTLQAGCVVIQQPVPALPTCLPAFAEFTSRLQLLRFDAMWRQTAGRSWISPLFCGVCVAAVYAQRQVGTLFGGVACMTATPPCSPRSHFSCHGHSVSIPLPSYPPTRSTHPPSLCISPATFLLWMRRGVPHFSPLGSQVGADVLHPFLLRPFPAFVSGGLLEPLSTRL